MLFGKRKRVVKRILIVEDEPLTAFDNETMLDDAGYQVVATLDSFSAAIEKLDEEQVDLILSDVRLTGKKTGIDLAKAAKERGIPVLFVTGHAPDNANELVLGCLTKPYSERTLIGALKAVDQVLSGGKPRALKGLQLFGRESSEA